MVLADGLLRIKPVAGKFDPKGLEDVLFNLGDVDLTIVHAVVRNRTIQLPLTLQQLGPQGWTVIGTCDTKSCTPSR